MRTLLLISALCIALAGCGDSPASDPSPVPDGTASAAADNATARIATDLGGLQGAVTAPGAYTFEVVVPEGNATHVTTLLSTDVLGGGRIDGPGCPKGTSATVAINIGTGGTQEAECADLPAGTHLFSVVFDGPVPGFSATVRGRIVQG